ncbi:MAG: RibD family protein, partial [Paludibacter sp.]
NTVLLVNPSLSVRNWSGKSPIRIAIDRVGRIPAHYHLLDGSLPTIVFTEIEKPNRTHLEFIKIEFDEKCLATILQKIYERNIHSVMVEGGAKLLNSFIEAGCWDEANIEVSPKQIQDGVPAPLLPLQPISRKTFDGHEWLYFKNPKKNQI